jgi:hypothetical protein
MIAKRHALMYKEFANGAGLRSVAKPPRRSFFMGFWSGMDELFFGPPGVAGGLLGDVVDAVSENPLTAIGVVAATVATGAVAFVAAPVIATAAGTAGLLGAASTGTAISTLSGAALTNASLAALGGGAVAAGGGGMALGTVVVAGAGAATGAAVSGGVVAATS